MAADPRERSARLLRSPRRYRAWTRRPARPVRYGLLAQVADAGWGRVDGRRGLPAVPVEDGGPVATTVTPRLEALRRLTRDRIAAERLRAEADCAVLADRLADVHGRREQMVEPAESLWQRLQDASKPQSDEELERRRLAEGDLPDTLVRDRRAAMHERRRSRAEADHTALRQAQAAAREEEEALSGAIADRRRVAGIRAQRLHEHAWRRVAVYWQHLVRAHPDGPLLNGRISPVGPDLPDWAREPDQRHDDDAPGDPGHGTTTGEL